MRRQREGRRKCGEKRGRKKENRKYQSVLHMVIKFGKVLFHFPVCTYIITYKSTYVSCISLSGGVPALGQC